MPGIDLTQLSSNWKKLQGQLQVGGKAENTSHGVKRKRPTERTEARNTKKSRIPKTFQRRPNNSTKMGLSTSKFDAEEHGTHVGEGTSSKLPNTSPQEHQDEINAGLNTTHRAGKYIAIDCEMVGTGPPPHSDNLLARVSLINYHGAQLYDTYVLPPPGIKVEDYRTFVSGIKPEHLRPGYARPFAQVQSDVSNLLQGRVLVGHALRNDLTVLALGHPKSDVRDTARYSGFRKQTHGPPALRFLAKEVLGLEIQAGEHSSLEDARAAMALFRRERLGFEGEVRRRFGVGKNGGWKMGGNAGDDEDEEDEGDEGGILDGEVDSDEDGEDSRAVVPTAKKKRKKKKRTKRK